jgi:preprotein translocase subunit SecG
LEILVVVSILDLFYNGKSDTSIAKGISAISLFFIWYDFLGDVVVCASYSTTVDKFKVYVMILKKVTASFFKILIWYSILFIVFGLGFFILFQPKLKDDTKETDGDKNEAFNSKMASIIKTFVMFTGELDFSSFPINTNTSYLEKHTYFKSAGVLLTYLYVLLFIFMIIIVLMNLLNAIAIRDAKEIFKNARLNEMQRRVQSLVFFEKINLLYLFLIKTFPLKYLPAFITKSLEQGVLSDNNLFYTKSNEDIGFRNIVNLGCNFPKKTFNDFRTQGVKRKETGPRNIRVIEEAVDQILKDTQSILILRNKNEVHSFKMELDKRASEARLLNAIQNSVNARNQK